MHIKVYCWQNVEAMTCERQKGTWQRKLWQWRGGIPLEKTNDKTKGNQKKKGDKDAKKKETCTCNHCQKKRHIEVNCWQKDPSKMPELYGKKKDAKTWKVTAAVEEENLLSVVDMEVEEVVKNEFHNDAAVRFLCLDMNDSRPSKQLERRWSNQACWRLAIFPTGTKGVQNHWHQLDQEFRERCRFVCKESWWSRIWKMH